MSEMLYNLQTLISLPHTQSLLTPIPLTLRLSRALLPAHISTIPLPTGPNYSSAGTQTLLSCADHATSPDQSLHSPSDAQSDNHNTASLSHYLKSCHCLLHPLTLPSDTYTMYIVHTPLYPADHYTVTLPSSANHASTSNLLRPTPLCCPAPYNYLAPQSLNVIHAQTPSCTVPYIHLIINPS